MVEESNSRCASVHGTSAIRTLPDGHVASAGDAGAAPRWARTVVPTNEAHTLSSNSARSEKVQHIGERAMNMSESVGVALRHSCYSVQ